MTLLNWTLGVSNRQKYPTAYTFNLRKKIKYMHVPHKAVFEWALLFFKIFSLGFKLPDFFFKEKHTAFNCNQYKKLGVIDY